MEDRRYDDASVSETINFDAETINFDANTVNFDAETIDLGAPAYHDFEEDEFQQLNQQRGNLKKWVIAFFGVFAACGLAVALTLFFERGKESTVPSVVRLDAASNNVAAVPSLQPSILGADLNECIINGVCSEDGSTCAIGRETCCDGETYDSIMCECTGGQWLCKSTDACNRPACALPTSKPASDSPTAMISQTPSASPTFKPTKLTPEPSSTEPTYQPSANSSTSTPSAARSSRAPSTQPTPPPTKKPSPEPSLRPSSHPTGIPTISPSSSRPSLRPSTQPSYKPTSMPSTNPSYQPSSGTSLQPSSETKYCVNIKFTTDDYPGDNGFVFLSKDEGEILYEQKTGFMKEPQTEYFSQICDLSQGSYKLTVTDTGGDGVTFRGDGSYVVDIDGHVILVGGRFVHVHEISHEIVVGIQPIMSKVDQEFLDAHNSRRQKFHESQDVSFRPLAWSPELAAGASAWAKERAKTCSTDDKEKGAYGQNIASQRLNSPDDAHDPDDIVSWWAPKNVDEKSRYNNQFTAVMWRSSLYVGCAVEVAPIENSNQYCQVTNCRYVRTPNCAVNTENWLDDVLDENGHLCDTVFCPGADENGVIVEGACHT